MFTPKWLCGVGLTYLCLMIGAWDSSAQAMGTSRTIFMRPPEGAQTVTIPLAVSETPSSGQRGYLAQRSSQPLDEITSLPTPIAETFAGKDFSAFEVAALPDGTRYLAVLTEEDSLKFLNRDDSPLWYARLYRLPPGSDAEPELLREGLQTQGNDVTFPVEIELPGVGSTHVTKYRTEMGYRCNSRGYRSPEPEVYTGRGPDMTVSGAQVIQEGKLTMTVTVPEEIKITPETRVTLAFEPMTPGLPSRSASGQVTDFLTLGTARFIVTDMAPDFSSATLAVVAGNLEQTLEEELQVGAHMPPFSQVDLLTRKAATREDVLAEANAQVGVVFVFGDIQSTGSQYGPPYGRPSTGRGSSVLPLPTAEVAEQLGLELQPKPLVVFITRQIGIDFIYQEMRNKTPDYLVLTDYADPLQTTFLISQNPGGMYRPPYQTGNVPSLRQVFNLPDGLSLVAFDRNGKVVYVNTNTDAAFLVALAEARAALKAAE